jgi:hypothetical protein
MILLHNFKGAMSLDHSKDTSVHVSTCTSYDFNELSHLCGSCGTDKTCVSTACCKNE